MGTLFWYLGIAAVIVLAIWFGLLVLALLISTVYLRVKPAASAEGVEDVRTIDDAVKRCRGSGLKEWDLVEYAQKLVAVHMKTYGFWNAFDRPARAFERRMGYCWQRAGALDLVLGRLGFHTEKVHAFINRFPEVRTETEHFPEHLSGHVWLRVRVGDDLRDVCPGNEDNSPGKAHFESITRVMNWGPGIFLLCYLGVPVANLLSYTLLSLRESLSSSGRRQP